MHFFILSAVLILSACAPKPEYDVILPYRIQVQSFTDTRLEESKLMLAEPFLAAPFIEGLHKALPSPVFGAVPAMIDLTLVEYNTTKNGDDFAMSLAMDYVVTGRKQVLAQGQLVCAQAWSKQFELPNLILNVHKTEQFTKAGMQDRIWGNMREKCIKDLATSLTNDLIQRKGAFS